MPLGLGFLRLQLLRFSTSLHAKMGRRMIFTLFSVGLFYKHSLDQVTALGFQSSIYPHYLHTLLSTLQVLNDSEPE